MNRYVLLIRTIYCLYFRSGNDERSVLVQWALCQGGGVGLGFMGTPSPPTGEESGINHEFYLPTCPSILFIYIYII